MMKESMLHELYYGNVSPGERERILDPKLTALIDKIDGIADYYKKLLPPEEYKKFKEMQDLQAQADVIQEIELFEYAFCAGARLMIDIFGYKGF